jgi:hypothetical protein
MLRGPETRVEDIRLLRKLKVQRPESKRNHSERDVTKEEARITVTWRLLKLSGLNK